MTDEAESPIDKAFSHLCEVAEKDIERKVMQLMRRYRGIGSFTCGTGYGRYFYDSHGDEIEDDDPRIAEFCSEMDAFDDLFRMWWHTGNWELVRENGKIVRKEI